MGVTDPFAALNLTPGASPADVDAAFRRLSKRAHPDAGGDAATFAALSEARYAALRAAREWPCDRCRGAGRVEVRRGAASTSLVCGACGGGGKKWA
jgi:DnaJ-class molecular chaperone